MKKHRRLLPNIILSIILVGLFVAMFVGCFAQAVCTEPDQEEEQTSLPTLIAPSVVYKEVPLAATPLTFVTTEDREELIELIDECRARKDAAHTLAEGARALGYAEDHPVILLAKEEWKNTNELELQYEITYNQLSYPLWDARMAEYPIATSIWLYLKQLGYNDYVCAGIMGNIMAEVGGQTLEIQHTLYSSGGGFYGMCQWSKKYYPEILGTDLETQCNFLRDTIKYEIDTFGYAYKRNFDYSTFLALTNERDAALAFAKTYERCDASSYSTRQKNAEIAYEYFVD